jgi:hypothetical protein
VTPRSVAPESVTVVLTEAERHHVEYALFGAIRGCLLCAQVREKLRAAAKREAKEKRK